MANSRDAAAAIKQQADIVQIIGERVPLTPAGANFKGLCPFHSEKTPSFTVNPQRGMYHCFGCSAGGSVIDFVMAFERFNFTEAVTALAARFGIDTGPGSGGGGNGKPSTGKVGGKSRPDIVATYDYTDSDGKLLAQVVRFEPKTFRQRRPDGAEGWTWGLAGMTLPLYQQPDVARVHAVFVVEGEKDADAMRSLGLPATCNVGGAGKWRAHHTAALAGKRVCIIADKDPAGRGHAEKVAAALNGKAESVRMISAPDPHKDAAAWIEGGGTRAVILEATKAAQVWLPATTWPVEAGREEAAPEGPSDTDTRLPIIEIIEGELPRMVDEAEGALLAAPEHGGLYQRGGRIVRIVRLEATTEGVVKRTAGAPVIQAVPSVALGETLGRVAQWIKFDGRSSDWRPKDCPFLVTETYGGRVGSWQLRPLVGVLDAPTLRPDGSILQKAGYDVQTGLVLLKDATAHIPETPSFEDALEAFKRLYTPLLGFPFDSDISRAVALSAILTACIRYALPTAPMFLFDAPAPGTGKSLLADVVSAIATGSPAASMSQASSPEEDAKRFLAVLMEGVPIVCIDNAERPFEGDALSSILTQPTYRGRVLGSSTTATVPTAVTFLGTGNNISVRGDLTRRALICRLDAAMEHPEERKFAGDLRFEIKESRGELVAAALTILRAYIVAGNPAQDCKPYGSFEQWSGWVRNSLVWIGEVDPCLSRVRVRAGDDSARQLSAMLTAWEAQLKRGNYSLKQAMFEPMDALLEIAQDIAGDAKGGLNMKKLGRWMAKNEDRISGGRFFTRCSPVGGSLSWKVGHVVNC